MSSHKVLHLVEYLHLGGIERLLEQLACHTPVGTAHFFSYESSALTGIAEQLVQRGHPVEITKKTAGRDWKLVFKLLGYIDTHQITVLHTHDFGPMEYAVLVKMLRPRLRLVHTQHTLHHFLKRKTYRYAFSVASWFYSSIIAVSTHVERNLIEHCPGLNKKRLKVIPNGVDLELFPLSSLQIQKSSIRLISVSRISPEKNLPLIIKACSLLKERGLSFSWSHVGSAQDQAYESMLRELVKTLELEESIHFLGFQSEPQNFLKDADIFLSASSTEGHPVSVLEAMATGKICLLSDIPPHRDLASEGLFFFDQTSAHSLADGLEQLTAREDLNDLPQRVRGLVQNQYSIQKMVSSYEQQY